jgi:hypothetical protein
MKIQLWYCKGMKQWRWTLTDDHDKMLQESGQRENLKEAMSDVAETVQWIQTNRLPE